MKILIICILKSFTVKLFLLFENFSFFIFADYQIIDEYYGLMVQLSCGIDSVDIPAEIYR